MKQITFATTNPTKIRHGNEVLNKFGMEFVGKKLDIIEPRDEDPQAIVIEKAIQAVKLLSEPVVVEDAGIFIRVLGGFPKTFVHFALDTIGIKGVMKLLEGEVDRHAEFRQSLAYMEPSMDKPIVFSYIDGNFTIADKIWEPKFGDTADFNKILIPPGESTPLCTFSPEWQAKRDFESNKETIHFLQLAKWLKSRT